MAKCAFISPQGELIWDRPMGGGQKSLLWGLPPVLCRGLAGHCRHRVQKFPQTPAEAPAPQLPTQPPAAAQRPCSVCLRAPEVTSSLTLPSQPLPRLQRPYLIPGSQNTRRGAFLAYRRTHFLVPFKAFIGGEWPDSSSLGRELLVEYLQPPWEECFSVASILHVSSHLHY